MSNKVLVTGAAGFIGFHLSKRLLAEGFNVVGVDIVNDYYDVGLKESRLKILTGDGRFSFHKIDLQDKPAIDKLFSKEKFDFVVNLAV